MIAMESEVRGALGLAPSITDAQKMRLMLAMATGHAAVRKVLHYDPEQRVGNAELYPRMADEPYGGRALEGMWDVNSTHTRANFETYGNRDNKLQLARIPIRSVSLLRVDPSAKFGQQSGDFGSSTDWTQGTEYAVEWDEDGVCRSGCLIAYGSWPTGLGTIKVQYRAGYSPLEFQGPQAEDSTDADGNVTKAGVDASPVKAAAVIACMAAYHQLAYWSQSQLTGLLTPGPKSSERLGDYSYSIGNPQAAALVAGMMAELPPQAHQLLEPFIHFGIMALG